MPAKRQRKSDASDSPVSPSKKKSPRTLANESAAESTLDEPMACENGGGDAGSDASVEFDELSHILDRTSEQDIEYSQEIVGNIRKLLQELIELKAAGAEDEVSVNRGRALKRQVMLQIIMMKRLNRFGHIRCKALREESASGKQEVDAKQLELMNVQYEVMHLKKEIQKCLQFKSRDQTITMESVETFMAEAPPEICDKEKIGNDEHLLKLGRLHYELAERKRLAQKYKDLVKERNKIRTSIAEKRKRHASLLPRVEEIIKAAKPLSDDQFGVSSFFGDEAENLKIQNLPAPLFVLYSQLTAYAEAVGKDHVTIAIKGEVPSSAQAVDAIAILAEEDDDDSESTSDREPSSKKGPSKPTDGKGRLLTEHPLNVVLDVYPSNKADRISMTFSFVICLNIVVVKPVMPKFNASSISNILHDLYLGDNAQLTPNPSNYYLLEKYNISNFARAMRNIGFAFHWVQRVCGLNFKQVRAGDAIKWESSVAAHAISEVVSMIQDRVKSRMELGRQVSVFEKRSVPLPVDCRSMYPLKLSLTLAKFQPINAEDYRAALGIAPAAFSQTEETAMHFTLSLCRPLNTKETLTAYVQVLQNYPNSAPRFGLTFTPGPQSAGSPGIPDWRPILRHLEEEVNIAAVRKCPDANRLDLLSLQVYHLMATFEVMLDSGRASERVYPRAFKGRDRARPFNYKPATGMFLFP